MYTYTKRRICSIFSFCICVSKEIELPDDDPGSLKLMLKLIHLQRSDLPEVLSPEALLQFALLADKYDCSTAVTCNGKNSPSRRPGHSCTLLFNSKGLIKQNPHFHPVASKIRDTRNDVSTAEYPAMSRTVICQCHHKTDRTRAFRENFERPVHQTLMNQSLAQTCLILSSISSDNEDQVMTFCTGQCDHLTNQAVKANKSPKQSYSTGVRAIAEQAGSFCRGRCLRCARYGSPNMDICVDHGSSEFSRNGARKRKSVGGKQF